MEKGNLPNKKFKVKIIKINKELGTRMEENSEQLREEWRKIVES